MKKTKRVLSESSALKSHPGSLVVFGSEAQCFNTSIPVFPSQTLTRSPCLRQQGALAVHSALNPCWVPWTVPRQNCLSELNLCSTFLTVLLYPIIYLTQRWQTIKLFSDSTPLSPSPTVSPLYLFIYVFLSSPISRFLTPNFLCLLCLSLSASADSSESRRSEKHWRLHSDAKTWKKRRINLRVKFSGANVEEDDI